MEDSMEVPYKARNKTTIWPSNPTPRHILRGKQNWERYMYPIVRVAFHLAYSFLCCAKAFKFSQVPCVYFCFYFHYSRRCVIEDLALIYVKASVLPMFSSKSFIMCSLTFRSLIHFEFIFVYGVKKYSNFILLHVAVQFSQHHLLKRLSLPHCIFLPPLSKIRCT